MSLTALTRPAAWARFWPLGPIFSMELRQMARRRRTYLLRILYLGVMLCVLSMAYAGVQPSRYVAQSLVEQAQSRALLGHIFLSVFSVFSVIAMQLIAPLLTSGSIGTERLRRTLDVLLMTPMPAWQIAAGKLFSRSLTAFSLIGLSLPVLAVVRLLGGVPWEDMFGAIALAGAVAVGSASIGLLLSCFLRRSYAVILLAYLFQGAIYFLLPGLLATIYFSMSGSRGPGSQSTYFMLMGAVNPAFTAALRAERSGATGVEWWPAIICQLGLALVLTLFTTALLRREARRRSSPAPAAVLPPLQLDLPPLPAIGDASQPGEAMQQLAEIVDQRSQRAPVFDNAVLWREVRRPLLGRPWQRYVAIALTLALLTLSHVALLSNNALGERDAQIPFAFCMTAVLMLIGVVLAATAIATEKESDTWTTLMMTPLSGRAIVWGKFRGVLRRLRWPFLLMVGHFTLFTICRIIQPLATLIILFSAATFGLPWIATGLYFSLRCSKTTTAVVLNLLLPLVFYAMVPMALSTLCWHFAPNANQDWSEAVLYYLPFYYQSTAIERMRIFGNYGHFILPVSGVDAATETLAWICLAAGLILVAVTALMVMRLAKRFDRIVGRAGTRI